MKGRSRLTWKEWTALAAALTALVALSFRIGALSAKPSTKDWGKAPQFSYEDRSGGTIKNSDLVGKFWVADFIFTRCAGSCPILSEKMRQIQKKWWGNPKLDLVTFTVDPDYDTVSVLKGYAKDLGANPRQWFFLTGQKKSLLKTAEAGFKLTAIENPGAEPGALFIHSTRLVLVGPDGTILGYYDGTDDAQFNQLRDDLKSLLK